MIFMINKLPSLEAEKVMTILLCILIVMVISTLNLLKALLKNNVKLLKKRGRLKIIKT